jgi:hypothetical protein
MLNPSKTGEDLHGWVWEEDINLMFQYRDRLCGLEIRVLGYRSRGPGSISDATRLPEK